ncbi:MAG: M23 family metallopeptidase [Marinilabiliales bacterium]
MARYKYKFNPETLSYDKPESGFKYFLLKAVPFTLSVIITSFLLYFVVFEYFIDSPEEMSLKRENTLLKDQYELLLKKMSIAEKVLTNLENRDNNIYRSIFGLDPIPSSIRESGIGGINRYSQLEGYKSSELIIISSQKIDNLLKKIEIQSKSFDKIVDIVKNKEQMMASIPAIIPISNKELTRISSGFGYRIHPVYKTSNFHTGMDFVAPYGADVHATGCGKVISCEYSYRGYGNTIIIDHGYHYKTLYAHLSKINVRPGQIVKRGQVIGAVGNTGMSSGTHLHYEVRYDNAPINPVNFYFEDISPKEYEELVKIASLNGHSMD